MGITSSSYTVGIDLATHMLILSKRAYAQGIP